MSNKRLKGLFVFPPGWCTSHPYMSIPCIMPYLNTDFDIQVLDLNLEYRKYLRSKKHLSECYEKISKLYTNNSLLKEKYGMIYDFLVDNRHTTNEILHNINDFANIEKYIFLSYYEWELAYFNEMSNGDKAELLECKTVSELMYMVENEEVNYFIKFYEAYFETIGLEQYNVVMLSLAGTQQMLSAITLCRYVKKRYPQIKIIVGGNPITKITNRIDKKWKEVFEKAIDYFVTYEGEYVLPELLSCIAKEKNISKIPNIIYCDKQKIIFNEVDTRSVNIECVSLPLFDNYKLNEYATPEIILPYYVTRGCYWKKCSFCDHDFGYSDCFRIKSIEKIIEDLTVYIKKYNAKYIHFVDEAIPPNLVKKLCEQILENNLNIKWFTCIKASKMFTLELCKLMKQAGCTFVSIGIETCSEEVLSKMVKGINKQDIEITLENMKQAQIWSHCFMINSFEGETDKNRWETFYYVRKNRRYFTSIGMGDFTLSRNAKIYSEIENNELEEISDFSNDLVYRSHSATSKEESLILQDYYSSINFTSEFFTQYIFEREHLALLISEQEGFSNHKWLLKEYMDKVQYNNKFLLKKVVDEKLYLYSLHTKEFYVLPRNFEKVIEKFNGNITEVLQDSCMSEYSNKSEVIKFLLDVLYV